MKEMDAVTAKSLIYRRLLYGTMGGKRQAKHVLTSGEKFL